LSDPAAHSIAACGVIVLAQFETFINFINTTMG
jgi:hypothetical protein